MLIDGRGLDAQSCLEMGYRVAYNAHKGKDRLAALATLDDVTDDVVNELFNDIGGHELGLVRVLPMDRRPVKEVRWGRPLCHAERDTRLFASLMM
jgi:hypothetical protein